MINSLSYHNLNVLEMQRNVIQEKYNNSKTKFKQVCDKNYSNVS